ncbi:MAG: hypothetical protein DSZ08_05200 [Sulfurovum sp.]|nr:MAG: hypothetical protein DSZ08_05200 [Sulfurovum sp.]
MEKIFMFIAMILMAVSAQAADADTGKDFTVTTVVLDETAKDANDTNDSVKTPKTQEDAPAQ